MALWVNLGFRMKFFLFFLPFALILAYPHSSFDELEDDLEHPALEDLKSNIKESWDYLKNKVGNAMDKVEDSSMVKNAQEGLDEAKDSLKEAAKRIGYS
jgi:uncharacterized protein YjbJ (UPF0337 family)